MENYITRKNFLILIIALPIWLSSAISLYEDRNKIVNRLTGDSNTESVVIENQDYDESFVRSECFTDKSCNDENTFWANEIMKGGYILHFRHAERDKWIDVKMYDALESDVHDLGENQSRLAENEYYKDAVCLNERGEIQARAMREHLLNIDFPIGYIISSPICRSRQTAEMVFGRYDDLDRQLVHRGPYKEKDEEHAANLKEIFLNLPVENGTNTIVSSHNGVIDPRMFDESVLDRDQYDLEEGGFYVISNKNGELKLVHRFYYFQEFIKQFYPRG